MSEKLMKCANCPATINMEESFPLWTEITEEDKKLIPKGMEKEVSTYTFDEKTDQRICKRCKAESEKRTTQYGN